MSRKTINVAQLAAAGRRWFAKPTAGFEIPSDPVLAELGIYANLLLNTPSSHHIADQIAKNVEVKHFAVQYTYIHIIQSWLKYNGPTLFVDKEMFVACSNTDALSSVYGSDLKVVYPCAYISIPTEMGFKSEQTGDTLNHIWFKILEDQETVTLYFGGKKSEVIKSPGRKLFIQGYWKNSADCSSYCLPLDWEGKTLGETILENSKVFTVSDERMKLRAAVEDLKAESEDLGNWMASFVLNICLLMQSYPRYMERMPKEHSERQNFKTEPPPISINLHRSSKRNIFQVVTGGKREDSEPTGRTVDSHWRRGHWRRQPHGDRWELENPESKIIVLADERHAHMKWIEPILIGLEETKEVLQ